MSSKYFSLEIVKDFSNKEVINNIYLPENKFPPRFTIQTTDFFCGGYFICYEKGIGPSEIAKACERSNWGWLGNLIGDFLIVYCDFRKNEICILTDQFGKFPLFYSRQNNKIIISTHFEAIKQELNSLTINIGTSLDLIARVLLPSEETVVSEINQLPQATLLKVRRDLLYSLTPLVDLEKFLSKKPPVYSSAERFSGDFMLLLSQSVAERLETLGNLRFGADISSGFDSSIVCHLLKQQTHKLFTCYSGISQYATADTDPKVVEEFTEKHDLKVEFIHEDQFYPFSTKKDLELAAGSPNQIDELMYNYYSQIAKDHVDIEFTGEGADEVYKAYQMDTLGRFPVQEEYFWTVQKLKLGLREILTDEAINILLDRDRFAQKKFFPSILAPSAILVNSGLFPILWENKLWQTSPFNDTRLVQLGRSIPRKNLKPLSKQEVWKTYKGKVFVASQFRRKQGPSEHVQLFLKERLGLVLSILNNSILAQCGFIRASEIVNDLRRGNIWKYLEGDTLSFLLATLKLEYFFQYNTVKIPDSISPKNF